MNRVSQRGVLGNLSVATFLFIDIGRPKVASITYGCVSRLGKRKCGEVNVYTCLLWNRCYDSPESSAEDVRSLSIYVRTA